MILSDHIASLIEEMLKEGGGSAEVKRNDLAAKIGCVPSQINYVITSRRRRIHQNHSRADDKKRLSDALLPVNRK